MSNNLTLKHVIISKQITNLWFLKLYKQYYLCVEPSIDSEPSASMEPPVNFEPPSLNIEPALIKLAHVIFYKHISQLHRGHSHMTSDFLGQATSDFTK